MRVLVIGATGALGRRIILKLRAERHDITAAARPSERLNAITRAGVRTCAVDILDKTAVRKAVAGHDAVINVATRVPPANRMFLPGAWRAMARVRREGSANVADAVITANVARLIQESFAPIYPDRGDRKITELTTPAPAPYNRSAIDAELSALRVQDTGATAVILRYAYLYGPGDSFADQIFSTVAKGWAPFFGRPDGYFSMVTQDDAAAATVAALHVPDGIYNVVDDEPMTRRDIANIAARIAGVPAPKFMPPWMAKLGGSFAETLGRSQRISNEKLKRATNWVPAMPTVHEGLRSAATELLEVALRAA